jgi:hypothetical protein
MGEVMKLFDLDRYEAVKVIFKKPIFDEDFPDKGMTAWLVDIEECKEEDCYKLYFNFEDFEEENKKYFKEVFFSNRHTKDAGLDKHLYTALESGNYSPLYSVYFGDINDVEQQVNYQLEQCLHVVKEET